VDEISHALLGLVLCLNPITKLPGRTGKSTWINPKGSRVHVKDLPAGWEVCVCVYVCMYVCM
jgi:hypothetical protein